MKIKISKQGIQELVELWRTFSDEKKWGDNAPSEFIDRVNEIAGQNVSGKEIEVDGQASRYTFMEDGSVRVRAVKKAALPASRRLKNRPK